MPDLDRFRPCPIRCGWTQQPTEYDDEPGLRAARGQHLTSHSPYEITATLDRLRAKLAAVLAEWKLTKAELRRAAAGTGSSPTRAQEPYEAVIRAAVAWRYAVADDLVAETRRAEQALIAAVERLPLRAQLLDELPDLTRAQDGQADPRTTAQDAIRGRLLAA